MPTSHDPYLHAAKRSLDEKRIKSRKQKIENKQKKDKDFLSKNIVLSDYIHIPNGLQKIFLLNIFIFIPYIIGLFVMFILLNKQVFHKTTDFQSFLFSWTIGYEFIAFTLLMLIIKSAFHFGKK